MSWTANQRRAIETIGRDILVSAGAGSGKTAVLAERCAYLISDAQPPCDIDRLLVVTFTEAAAEEMRIRIGRALRERLKDRRGDRRLREQIVRLDLASISTLHAFCRRTLVRYFAAAGLDPDVTLLDEHEAAVLRDETMRTLFDELTVADTEMGRAFDELRHQYGAGRDDAIRTLVLKLSGFLGSLPDPDAWRRRVLEQYQGLSGTALTPDWSDARKQMLMSILSEPLDALRRTMQRFAGSNVAADWVAYAGGIADRVDDWLTRMQRGGHVEMDAVCRDMAVHTFARAPMRSKKIAALPDAQLAEFDGAKADVVAARDALKKLFEEEARYSEADWAEGLVRVAPHVRLLLGLTEKFDERYEAAKTGLRVHDFADLERQMLNLLRNSPETAQRLRDQFDHVLVDEYQDINPLQDELLRLVSRENSDDQPGNLFCVGDVKQSIYRFRLAEPELFVRRQDVFRDEPRGREGLRVALPDNFRSQPAVLDAVNRILSRLMTRDLGGVDYDERMRLRPGQRHDAPTAVYPAVEMHLIERMPDAIEVDDDDEKQDLPDETPRSNRLELELVEQEAVIAGRRLLQMRRERPDMRWSDVVILMRAPRVQAAQVARVLGRMGIPSLADRAGGLFDAREVRDVLALLSILDNAQQDIPLATLLRSPLCASLTSDGTSTLPLSEADLAAIRLARPHGPYHRAAVYYAESGSDIRLRRILHDLFERLNRWRGVARRETAANLIDRLYSDTRYPEYVAALTDGAQRRANLLALHERARQFSGFSRQGLPRFLQFLEELRERDDDLAAGSPPGAADDVVRLMSIHRAKGLEFPVVVLLRTSKRFNFTDTAQSMILDRRMGLGLKAVDPQRRITYPTLAHRAAARRVRDETLSEELRLLYVALTRARDRILVVAHASRNDFEALGRPCPLPPGPLPSPQRRGASSVLQWLLAALGAEPAGTVAVEAHGQALIEAIRHASPDRIDDYVSNAVPGRAELLQLAGRLEAIPHTTAISTDERIDARRAVERMGRGYIAELLTAVPSVVAVSDLKRRWFSPDDPEAPALHTTSPGTRPSRYVDWRRPGCISDETKTTAVERGTLTHLFLQHLDLVSACDAADLARQRDALVRAGRLTETEAAVVDLESIEWFFDQPQGRALRSFAGSLHRETPFVLAVESTRYTPDAKPLDADDFVVVRGIIDLLYFTPDGMVLLDWKTDAGSPEVIDERIRLYAPRLDIYAHAAARMFAQPVVTRRLVFLHARRVADV